MSGFVDVWRAKNTFGRWKLGRKSSADPKRRRTQTKDLLRAPWKPTTSVQEIRTSPSPISDEPNECCQEQSSTTGRTGPARALSFLRRRKDEDDVMKVMLVGDSGVGKTCFLIQFKDGKFLSGTFIATVGIDFRNKIINVDGTKVKLQIWDTAGQERFRSVTHAYYRDAHALLLLYDVTNRKSYNNTRAWLGEIREYAQGDVVILLLGNKCDCKLDREVSKEDGEKLAREYNVPFMETSAKTSLNVEFAFNAVARELIYKRSSYPEDPRFNVKDYVETKSEKTDPGGRCLCA